MTQRKKQWKGLTDGLKDALQKSLINIGNTEEGKKVISIYTHEGYQAAQSSDYDKEREAFNKAFPDTQRDHIDYFINKATHYGGELGGLGETIAESNALLTTPKTHELLAIRSQYLQQYFPRTIALLDQKSNEALA